MFKTYNLSVLQNLQHICYNNALLRKCNKQERTKLYINIYRPILADHKQALLIDADKLYFGDYSLNAMNNDQAISTTNKQEPCLTLKNLKNLE